MAAYLRPRTKETKKKHTTTVLPAATEDNTEHETGKGHSVAQTASPEQTNHAEIRTRLLKNPTVLDALDSVHRSLLYNNLKFEPDTERNHLDDESVSNVSSGTETVPEAEKSSEIDSEATRDRAAATQRTHQRPGKVNIAPASAADTEEGAHGISEDDDATVEEEQEKEEEQPFEDWNNNIEGALRRSSRVKMMVQRYEKETAPTAPRASDSTYLDARTHFSSERLHRIGSVGDVETSDFESASVTSGSSVADGGCRSVRTSSAFSEGSRDVASMDRFELVTAATTQGEAPGVPQPPQEEPGGHNTMITININYRCDTNPLRTNGGGGSKGPEVAIAEQARTEVTEKLVDIVVSSAGHGGDVAGGRKSGANSDKFATDEGKHLLRDAPEPKRCSKSGADELMDLDLVEDKQAADPLGIEGPGTKETFRGSDQHRADRQVKHRRSSLATNRSCQTPDNEEYHDCDELHDSTLSFYEQAKSQPVTPQDREKKRRSGAHHNSSSSSSNGSCVVVEDEVDEQPMIRIVQELTEDQREVTSTITLNKAQIEEMQKANDAQREMAKHTEQTGDDESAEKRRKSRRSSGGGGSGSKKRHEKSNLHRQQRIIDDNFCNEILDSTIHFDRLYGINREQQRRQAAAPKASLSPSPTRVEECFSDSVVCDIASPGDESFDSGMSVGKLEGKPRYSGKTMGRLMMKRLKKLQQAAGKMGSGTASDGSTSGGGSSQLLQTSGPKKPPRTFANSPKRSTAAATAPSCPTHKELDEDKDGFGWKVDAKPKSHQVGWTMPAGNGKNQSIPAQVYSMLHYSEDESRKRLIRTGNSKPAPQQLASPKGKQSKSPRAEVCHTSGGDSRLGPKLNIDTVDGATNPITPPRRHSSSTDFDRFVRESNAKSTPHRRGGEHQHHTRVAGTGGTSTAGTRRLIEQFLSEERQNHPAARKLPAISGERRRRTTGGIFERRRQQQENFLDDARRTNHEPRRRKTKQAPRVPPPAAAECCPMVAEAAAASRVDSLTRNSGSTGKVAKRRTFRKAALLKRTRTLFEASKKKIWAIKKFETPKKLNTVSTTATTPPSKLPLQDPNINRNSSAKKKQGLHHKHLGFTPDHVRCRSCRRPTMEMEVNDTEEEGDEKDIEVMLVPVNYRNTQSAAPSRASFPGGEENKENDCRGRGRCSEPSRKKSVRSLNFAPGPGQQRSPKEEEEGVKTSPRKGGMQQLLSETKFLKTLRNLKISPKKMFRFASQSSTAGSGSEHCAMGERESHGQGEFHSFDDLNLDNVAHMGDFLGNIRRMVDGDNAAEESEYGNPTVPFRQQQIQGSGRMAVDEDEDREEPIYQEISPKGNKTILNEFISKETNKRYLMVNNNPNILYATVSKPSGARIRPGLLVRARSLTDVASAGTADPIVTSTPVSKPQNNTSKSQVKPSNRRRATIFFPETDDDDHRQGGEDAQDRGRDEPESGLYMTALADSRREEECGAVGGECSGNTRATSASTTRRSLFSQRSSLRSTSGRPSVGQSEKEAEEEAEEEEEQLTTDESDVSVLQDEAGKKVVAEPPIVRERVEDRLAGLVNGGVRREHERFQQRPAPTAVAGNGNGRGRGYQRRAKDDSVDQFSFEKDIIVEERKEVVEQRRSIRMSPKKINIVGTAPLGCFDTDSEIESVRRYNDKEIEELVVSLHNNVTLSDMGTTPSSSVANGLDDTMIGYDTVDFVPPMTRVFRCPPAAEKHDPRRNLTIDTADVSELISHPGDAGGDTFATSNVSPISRSPSAGSGADRKTVMRNLKDKLRSSFRKSKSFIKNERQRFANYLLEERSDSKASSSSSASASTSASSSAAGSPRKRPGMQRSREKNNATVEQNSDALYCSVVDGSSGIVSTDSMTELSSQYMSELILQIKRQADARKQLKQALAICRSTREFECSQELIEAERLLLLATLKETAARNELSQIDYAANGMTLAMRKRVGVVALSHFEFPLKEAAISDALFNYFYVLVCTYKDQVKGTLATERRSDGRVYFGDCQIRFLDLDADYEIRVEVFVLRLRKNVKNYSFESRYHLEKDTQKNTLGGCPSPSKKLREAGKLLSLRSSSPKSFDFDNEFSRFKSQGFLTLTSFALLTSNGTAEPDATGGGVTFVDATYTTARTSTSINDPAAVDASTTHGPYHSVSGNFQQLIRRQGNEHVFLVEDFKHLTLDSMAYTSNMAGTISMSVSSEVRFMGSDVCGFLDVGEKGEGGNAVITWNRRWCKMNGFALEFWNYPQECQEKQPIQCIDLVRCVNDRIELAERSICSRPRTLKVDIFASQAASAVFSCNSSGIGSYKSTDQAAPISPNSIGGEARSTASGGSEHLRPLSPERPTPRGRTNIRSFLLAADTQADLKRWLHELNRTVKFLKEWKI